MRYPIQPGREGSNHHQQAGVFQVIGQHGDERQENQPLKRRLGAHKTPEGEDQQERKEQGVDYRVKQVGGEGGDPHQRAPLLTIRRDHLVNLIGGIGKLTIDQTHPAGQPDDLTGQNRENHQGEQQE